MANADCTGAAHAREVRACLIDGCGEKHKAHGLCARHYKQKWKTGSATNAPISCAQCGKEIGPRRSGVMYCSNACKLKAWKASRPEKHAENTRTYRAKLVKNLSSRACAQCGESFLGKLSSKFCSDACKAKRDEQRAIAARNKRRKKDYAAVVCKQCSGRIENPNTFGRPRDLCGVCLNTAKKKARRASKMHRSAIERGVLSERFDPLEILARDKWKCQLCGAKTPKEKRGTYDDNAPELDHIIPLSLGGPHTKANTQCACRKCNQAKSNRPLGQMLLIG